MDIKLIIFDCDGTLIDSEYINNKATSEILIELGHTKFTVEYCLSLFAGCSSHDIIKALKEDNIQNPEETLNTMNIRALKLAKTNLKPIKHAIETVTQIKIPKAVASNGEKMNVIEFLKMTGLIKYFPEEQIFTTELVAKPKPAPDLHLYTAKKMGNVDPKNCLVIEDSIRGIIAAKNAGMNVLAFTGGNHHHNKSKKELHKAGASAVIETLPEILGYLK
jgi:HAD superfamily hydrolase (TIGR01509 family)